MFINTQRLLIREFQESDLTDFAVLMADPEVMKFSLNGPLDKEQSKAYLNNRIITHYKEYGYGLWALIHQEDQRLIGYAGLINQVFDHELYIELGYRLLPSYWHKGLAMEANQAIIDYAFYTLSIPKIISIIDPANSRSLATAKRIGMQDWKATLFHGIPVRLYSIEWPLF